MPQPPQRRAGSSRRAQYGFLIGYAVAIAGMLVAVLLLAIAIVDPRGFEAIKGAALDGSAPVQSGGRTVSRGISGFFGGIGNYFRAGSQNAQLKAELESAQRELMANRIARAENQRLRALLRMAQESRDEVAIARIVGSSFESPRRLAVLSAGSGQGVRVGMPVRSADGLIGRVLETGRWASRVLLVSDGASSVPVRSLRGNVPALAVGRGDGTVELRTLEVGANPFRAGDILVTSGVGGIFPPDVPAVEVIGLSGDTAIARPIADPGRVEWAVVQPAYQPAATGELDEGAPTEVLPPVAGPPTEAGAERTTTPPQLQRNPRYQPALQDPQAGVNLPGRRPAGEQAPPAQGPRP